MAGSRSRFELAWPGAGAVGTEGRDAALVTQYVYGMQPCPWCVLQRAIFIAISLMALLGLAMRRTGATLMLLLAASGVIAALWQHFVAAATASCALSMADRIVSSLKLDEMLPEVFMATASCADAKVNLFGVPYEFWSLAIFVMLACTALMVAFTRPARSRRR